MGTNWRAVKAEDELTTLRADLAAALERVGELQIYSALLEAEQEENRQLRFQKNSNWELGVREENLRRKAEQERDQLKKKSTTWREAHDAIYAENKQLKRERDEAVAYQGEHRQAAVDGGYIQGFEDCREAVAVRYDTLAAEIEAEVGGDVVSRLSLRQGARAARKEAAAIHALTVPERKETKE